jgi:hypothetical protein
MTTSPDDEGLASRSHLPLGSEVEKPALGSKPVLAATLEASPGFSPSSALMQASIVTPGNWVELDLDPKTRHKSVRRAVRRAIVRSRSLKPDAVSLIALLDRLTVRAGDAGAFYCASLVMQDATRGALIATVVIQVHESPKSPLRDTLSLSVGERCAALVAIIRKDPEWGGSDVRVVALPLAGPAVRLHIRGHGLILQYIVPFVAEIADVVLTFTCPCPPYAELMTELFDAMAESLVLQVR